MKVSLLFQNENNNLAKEIEENNNVDKVYAFSSSIKENSLKVFEKFEDNKSKIYVYMGIDKKNTTKKTIDTLFEISKELYVYDNNAIVEFVSGIMILEDKKQAIMYITNGSFSEAKLKDDFSIITKIVYDLNDKQDKKEYKDELKKLLNIQSNNFVLVNEDIITNLIKDKKIFSNMQYVHKVKSISDYIGETKKEEKVESIPQVNLLDDDLDIDFDIDLDEEIIVEQDEEEIIELEDKNDISEDEEIEISDEVMDLSDMLLEKADIDLEISNEDDKEESIKKNAKKLDLNNASNFIFQLPAKQKNKKDKDMIKIPNYIKTLIPNFFNIEDGKNKVIDGIEFKVLDINLDIIDARNNLKYKDKNAKIMLKKGQTYFYFKSNELINLNYEESDIARIIKLADDTYHIEIVSKDLEEYNIWTKITNIKFKGNTDRMYGVM